MRAYGIVETDPRGDQVFSDEAIHHFMQIDRFVFEATPQPLDEDVVHASPTTVHGDLDIRGSQNIGESGGRKLAALIGVEDSGRAEFCQRFLQGINAEAGIDRVR